MAGQQDYGRQGADDVDVPVSPAATASMAFINEVFDTLRPNNQQPSDRQNANRANDLAFLGGSLATFTLAPEGQALAPQEQAPVQDRSAIANHIRNLDHRDFRVREDASNQLARAGAAALPEIYRTLDNRATPIEVRQRCDQLLNNLRHEGFQNLLEGLSHSDTSVRNAAARLVGDISTRDLLEATGRVGSNMTDLQLENLRSVVMSRVGNDAARLQLYRERDRSEAGQRVDLAVDMLTNPGQVPKTSAELGFRRFSSGNRDAETRRLLERGAQQDDCSPNTLYALAHLQNEQGDREGWLSTTQRLFEHMQRHGIYGPGKPPEPHPGVEVTQLTDVFGRQSDEMRNNMVLSPELRDRIQTMQRQVNEAITRHTLQPRPPVPHP
jgi:hypothetical protein